MSLSILILSPVLPFRLDLTVWTLRSQAVRWRDPIYPPTGGATTYVPLLPSGALSARRVNPRGESVAAGSTGLATARLRTKHPSLPFNRCSCPPHVLQAFRKRPVNYVPATN